MTWTAYEIPLQPEPQTLSVSLAVVTYKLTVKWNAYAQTWILDIADQNGAGLAQGLPFLPGQNLLAQYAYLGIGGSLVVQTNQDPYALPTATNLGTDSHLYFMVQS
jgi:hypothetical protein